MIFELLRYTLRPRVMPEALARIEAACARRRRHSELGGIWTTEIGPLNQIVMVWSYADISTYGRVQAALAHEADGPPRLDGLLVGLQRGLFTPLPGPPMLQPGRPGPIYELRSYRVRPGVGVQGYTAGWEAKLDERLALSPLAVAMVSDVGPLNNIVQIWPYASYAQRAEVRRVATEHGVLPPPGALDVLELMENLIMLPALFSPMQ
ncbi:MAG TPA: NIPSNAP family protein [bacterium]|nr:NIPSNAP family protein [bacterium]